MFLISIVYTVYLTGVSSLAGFAVLIIYYPVMVNICSWTRPTFIQQLCSVGTNCKTPGQFPSEGCPSDGPEGGQDVGADQLHQADQDVRLGETFPGENTQPERR